MEQEAHQILHHTMETEVGHFGHLQNVKELGHASQEVTLDTYFLTVLILDIFSLRFLLSQVIPYGSISTTLHLGWELIQKKRISGKEYRTSERSPIDGGCIGHYWDLSHGTFSRKGIGG